MRLASITIGQYYPGTSLLHRIDPRTKILASTAVVVCLFLVDDLSALLLLAAALLIGIGLAHIPPLWIYRGLRPLFFLILVTFLFQLIVPVGEELARIGPIIFYRGGLVSGAFVALRLVLLFLSGTVLTLTTPPVLLTDAFSRLMSPLGRIGLPVYEVALMMTIALRFIPTLLMELDRIIKAQEARGAGLRSGGPVRRARALLPVLVPLFVMSFRHADELALAMEARCYRGGRGRTVRRKLSFGRRDALFAVALLAVLAAALWLGRLS